MTLKQQTLAMAVDQSGYEQSCKPERRDEFLATMEAIVPRAALCAGIERHYPKAGNGRPPIGLERSLRRFVSIEASAGRLAAWAGAACVR